MAGKEIRNFELNGNGARVYFDNNGDIKYKGTAEGKKQLRKLAPIFEAIMGKSGDVKKLDTDEEKTLMQQLQGLLMADDIVDDNEIKLGDAFVRSGKSVNDFLSDVKNGNVNITSPATSPEYESKFGPSSINLREGNPYASVPEGRRRDVSFVAEEGDVLYGQNYKQILASEDEGSNVVGYLFQGGEYNLTITATTYEDLEAKVTKYLNAGKLESSPTSGEEEQTVRAERQQRNLERLKTLIEVTDSDVDTITDIVLSNLDDDSMVNKQSPERTELIVDLMKTRNPKIIDKLLSTEFSGDYVENKDLMLALASLCQDIAAKENAGVKLTSQEHELKARISNETLTYAILDNAEATGMHIDIAEGNLSYSAESVGSVSFNIYAESEEALRALKADIEAAGEDKEALSGVFNKYKNTTDKYIARTLATNANKFNAKTEDVIDLINNSGMFALSVIDYDPPTKAGTVTDFDDCIESNMEHEDGKIADGVFIKTEEYQIDENNSFEYKKFYNEDETKVKYVAKHDDKIFTADSFEQLKSTIQNYIKYQVALADRIYNIYTNEATKGDPANMKHIEEALKLAGYREQTCLLANEMGVTAGSEEADRLKANIIKSFFEATTTEDGIQEYVFKPSRRPTAEEIESFINMLDNIAPDWNNDVDGARLYFDNMKSAILEAVTFDDLGPNEWPRVLETRMTTAELQEHYAKIIDDPTYFDVENNLEEAKANLLKFIDNVKPNIELVPFDKLEEKFGDVQFVKDHLGPQLGGCYVLRKITVLDLEIKEQKNGDEVVGYSTKFDISSRFNTDDELYDVYVELHANTREELLELAKPYIELQNILYESDYWAGDEVGSRTATDEEIEINYKRLIEMFKDENLDENFKRQLVAKSSAYLFMNQELKNTILDSKDVKYIGTAFVERFPFNEAQVNKLIESLGSGEKGSKEYNMVIKCIVRYGTVEQKLRIYDSMTIEQRFEFLERKYSDIEDVSDRFCQLITDDSSHRISFTELADFAIRHGLTLPKAQADAILSKISYSAGEQAKALYRNGDLIFTMTKYNDGSVKFGRKSIDDYADAMQYEIDHNGFDHDKELAHVKTLASMSPYNVARAMERYSKDGRGMLEDYDSEWGGPGSKDLMPLAEKILHLSVRHESTTEYRELKNLIDEYKSSSYGRYDDNSDFKSGDAKKLDKAILAYINKVFPSHT